jgi:hypothetical protein
MSLRQVTAVVLPKGVNQHAATTGLDPGYDDDGAPEPMIEWVSPTELWIDEAYQRSIGSSGLALIRRVARNMFSWRKFKLPSVTRLSDGRLVVLDGQHTATMAATRGIARIPVLVVQTFSLEDQAEAFVGQNMNRTAITTQQQHRAKVTAGDEAALLVDRVVQKSGLNLLMFTKNDAGAYKPGDTLALGTIKTLVNRRKEDGAVRVLELLVKAGLAPITSDYIKAVECLLFESEFAGAVRETRIVEAMTGAEALVLDSEAAMFAARHRVPKWKGLTTVLFQAATKRRAA